MMYVAQYVQLHSWHSQRPERTCTVYSDSRTGYVHFYPEMPINYNFTRAAGRLTFLERMTESDNLSPQLIRDRICVHFGQNEVTQSKFSKKLLCFGHFFSQFSVGRRFSRENDPDFLQRIGQISAGRRSNRSLERMGPLIWTAFEGTDSLERMSALLNFDSF